MRKTNINGKKGEISFLGEHTLNILIAIGCIIVLLFIGYKVYDMFSEKTDFEKAESNFKIIKGEIELILTFPENKTGEIIIYPPENWVLRSYQTDFPQSECYGKISCLCLCEEVSCYGVQKVCEGFPYGVEINTKYIVGRAWYNPARYLFDPIEYPNSIGFTQAVEGLRIYSKDNKIIIEQKQNENQ